MRGSLEPGGHAQQGRFSATGRADQADELSFFHAQTGAAQRLDGAAVLRIGLAGVLHFENGDRGFSHAMGSRPGDAVQSA